MSKRDTYIFLWMFCSFLLVLGLSIPIIKISVGLEVVIKDAMDKQPAIAIFLQEYGIKVGELTAKLPPTNESSQSIISSTWKMFKMGSPMAGIIILSFSIVTPILKQIVFLFAVIGTKESRLRWVTIAKNLHKWAMVDVFVLSMVVITLSASSGFSAHLQLGFYFFLLYFVLASFVGKMAANISTCEDSP